MVAVSLEVMGIEVASLLKFLSLCTGLHRGVSPLSLALVVGGWEKRPRESPLSKSWGEACGAVERADVENETTLA